jgi:DNA repair ATPase RecN
MSGEEQVSSGGGYRKPIDPKKLKQIQERWKQSESIRGLTNKHHQEQEVPAAEEELLKDLQNINPKSESPKSKNVQKPNNEIPPSEL